MADKNDLLTVKQAAKLIGQTPDKIAYYLQYKPEYIHKYDSEGNFLDKSHKGLREIRVSKSELLNYLNDRDAQIEKERLEKLGKYNKDLAFDGIPEKVRTKHVHRLHQYKGKFIPQLVEYFLERNFEEDNLILDPFVGSGTTLVQANEMGIRSMGIDITPFNCMISEVKTREYDLDILKEELKEILSKTREFSKNSFENHEREIKEMISEFNREKLPKLEKNIDKKDKEKMKIYAKKIENTFKNWLMGKGFEVNKKSNSTQLKITKSAYLQKWFSERSLQELIFYRNQIKNYKNQDIMKIILTRAARSSRLVPHFDLASPKEPIRDAYYCFKHKIICYPIQKAIGKLDLYTRDSIKRIEEYSKLRKDIFTKVIPPDDSRYIKLENYLDKDILNEKFDGVFTSPPYVGNIDYHEQHIYAYELLKIQRFDEKEIGPLSKGKTKKAQLQYIEDIAKVLRNLRKYMKKDAKIFFVANDGYNLYPAIAEKAKMKIVKEHLRPVSNRSERDKQFYSETIFEMKYI